MQTKETPTLGSISASCTKEAVERDSNPVPSQEAGLLDLLRKADGYAYALAHGYDSGGQTSLWARGPWRVDMRYGYGRERPSASR